MRISIAFALISVLAVVGCDKEKKDSKLAKLCVEAGQQLGDNAGKADMETFQQMLSNALQACAGGCDDGDDASCKALDTHINKLCGVSPSVCESLCKSVKGKALKKAACDFKPGAKSDAGAAPASKTAAADLSKYPGTEDGAKQLLTDIRKDEATARAMTAALKPTADDYKAVFEGDKASVAEKGYEPLWSSGEFIKAKPENTELKIWKATSEDIKAWTKPVEADFPGGYKKVGPHLKGGITMYRWKYVKPGETLGMAFDGLAHVNGHWVWFPKPWRVLGGE